jgi:hypothetical protein
MDSWIYMAMTPANRICTAVFNWHIQQVLTLKIPLEPRYCPNAIQQEIDIVLAFYTLPFLLLFWFPMDQYVLIRIFAEHKPTNRDLILRRFFRQEREDLRRQNEMLLILTYTPPEEHFLKIRQFCLASGVKTGALLDKEIERHVRDTRPEIAERIRQEKREHQARLAKIREDALV